MAMEASGPMDNTCLFQCVVYDGGGLSLSVGVLAWVCVCSVWFMIRGGWGCESVCRCACMGVCVFV